MFENVEGPSSLLQLVVFNESILKVIKMRYIIMSSLGLLLILLIVGLRFCLANIYVMIKLQRIQTDYTSADDQNCLSISKFFLVCL